MGCSFCHRCSNEVQGLEDQCIPSFSVELTPEEELEFSSHSESIAHAFPDEITTVMQKLEASRNTTFYKELDKPLAMLHNSVVHEGQLYRWKEPKWLVQRWCQLTPNGFRLYRDQCAAVSNSKPLLVIPHGIIDSIQSIQPSTTCPYYRIDFRLKKPISTLSSPNDTLNFIGKSKSMHKASSLSRIIPSHNEKYRQLTSKNVKEQPGSWTNRLRESETKLTFAINDKESYIGWHEAFCAHLVRADIP